MQETWVWSLGQEDPLEKGIAIHSSFLAWRIPWTEEPGELQSMEPQKVRHNWGTNTFTLSILKIHSILLPLPPNFLPLYQSPLSHSRRSQHPPHVPPAAGTASVWTFAPPQASSHLLPFTSSQALHCLETKFRVFSSTMTTHETLSLHSSLTFVCLPAPYAPAELESPTSATTPTGLAIHVSVF